MIHGIACNYHWSEREIFALRYDRFCAYCEEINIDLDEPVTRLTPHLPEEDEFDAEMRKYFAQNHGRK